MTDHELLRSFARERSDTAFAELVTRHLPLVYSAALRQTGGDSHAAKDVAQLVFTDLARKAAGLSDNVILAGWLHRATIYAARQILRGERRRQLREQQAAAMNTIEPQPEKSAWPEIHLLLDEVLNHLNKIDRDALLLRFFQQQSLAEVGESLGGTEEAARKRVTRALEKLRLILQRSGVTTTAAALSATISANAVQPAPAGLAAAIAHSSFGAAGTGTTFAFLKIMTATQLKIGLGALVAAGVATAFVVQHQTQARLRNENQSLRQQIAQLQNSNDDLSNRIIDLSANKKLSNEQFNDLLRLRSEVGMLRQRTNELWRAQSPFKYSPPQDRSSESNSAAEQQKQVFRTRINNIHHLVAEMVLYASDNQGQIPTNFDQNAPYANRFPETVTNGLEIVYQGTVDQMTNPSDVIIVQESDASPTFDGRWAKAYGFADGHSEIQERASNDFSAFEQMHSVAPPGQ